MKGEAGKTENGGGQARMERGLDLVAKHRQPNPPDELNDADRALYDEASKAINRAWLLRGLLGDDVTASAAADTYVELAGKLSECKDGAWGEESGRLSEHWKRSSGGTRQEQEAGSFSGKRGVD